MKLRITRSARADIQGLFVYIAADSPKAAEAVVERILVALEQLRDHPMLGHVGHDPTTRELLVGHTPYLAVYRIEDGKIVVLRVRHGARRRDADG